jgi:hypothetical protein
MKILATECTFAIYPDMMGRKPRQLFVTRSQTLATKMCETYRGMHQAHVPGLVPNSLGVSASRGQRLVDTSEELRRDNKRFGQLSDDDFPLFVSFDRVGVLLLYVYIVNNVFFLALLADRGRNSVQLHYLEEAITRCAGLIRYLSQPLLAKTGTICIAYSW